MKNLNYQIYHILYQIFKIILNIYKKPSIRIYINKIENRIMIKIETGYLPKLLIPEKMELLKVR